MIKNIIFDMGNVLMDYNPSVPLNQYLTSEADRKMIEKELFNGPEWIEGDRGTMDDDERYEKVKKRVPKRLHEALKNCVYHWEDSMKPIKQAQEFVKEVKEKGYKIYILSNATYSFYDYFPRFAEPSYFDGIVVSAYLHIIKPDERIYSYLLDQYGLKPEECLFIDDRENNVEAAKKLGIHGAVYKNDFEIIKREYQL